MSIQLDETLAHAVAWDAATANASKHGRKHWNLDDVDVAIAKFNELIPELPLEARLRLTGNADGIVED